MHYKHLNYDYNARKKLKNKEITLFLWNYLKKCTYLNTNKQKHLHSFLLKNSTIRKNSLKNICLETGLERSIVSTFGISRHVFRKKSANLVYPGIRKASW